MFGSFHSQRGIALIITLLVVTVMIVAILEFNTMMRVSGQTAWNFRDQTAAYYLAKAGINASLAILMDEQSYNTLTTILTKGEEFGPLPLGAPVLESEAEGTYKFVLSNLPVSDGNLTIEIKDEDGKFCINNLVVITTTQQTGSTGTPPGTGPSTTSQALAQGQIRPQIHTFIQNLFNHLNIDLETLFALEDWLDFGAGDTELGHGTEEGTDPETNKPYHAKNGPLETITELRMIKGFIDQVLTSLGATREEGFLNPETNKLFTVYQTDGININTASSTLLQALSDQITPDIAKDIIANRKQSPYQKADAFRAQYNIDTNIQLAATSKFFRVKAIANYNDIFRIITAVVKRQTNKIEIFYWRVD